MTNLIEYIYIVREIYNYVRSSINTIEVKGLKHCDLISTIKSYYSKYSNSFYIIIEYVSLLIKGLFHRYDENNRIKKYI